MSRCIAHTTYKIYVLRSVDEFLFEARRPWEVDLTKMTRPLEINWKGDKKLFEPELNAIAERVSTNTVMLT